MPACRRLPGVTLQLAAVQPLHYAHFVLDANVDLWAVALGASVVVSQPTSPLPMGAAPKLTCSKSMQLFTEVRAITRTSSVKSTAQIEEEEMSSMPKFKALPLNKKVLESHGDMGVPRVQRPPSTKPTEFNLSTSMRGEARKKDDDELSTSSAPAYTFKVRMRPLST